VCTRAQGVDAPLDRPHAERDAPATYKSQGHNLGMVAVTALFNASAFSRRYSSRREQAWCRGSLRELVHPSSVPRAALSVLDERGRHSSAKRSPLQTIRGAGVMSGSESD